MARRPPPTSISCNRGLDGVGGWGGESDEGEEEREKGKIRQACSSVVPLLRFGFPRVLVSYKHTRAHAVALPGSKRHGDPASHSRGSPGLNESYTMRGSLPPSSPSTARTNLGGADLNLAEVLRELLRVELELVEGLSVRGADSRQHHTSQKTKKRGSMWKHSDGAPGRRSPRARRGSPS